jgi:hypothetical protein
MHMAKKSNTNDTSDWQVMVDAAKRGLEDQGYRLTRVPGRGLSNVWNVERNGKTQTASIRTTRNRWIAFPPLAGGTKWKTLDDVDLVVVAAVDSHENPVNVEIYIFQASDVRKRFNSAYVARKKAGQTIRDDFGMWVGLDVDPREIPSSVGSGLAETSKPVAILSLASLTTKSKSSNTKGEVGPGPAQKPTQNDLTTIAEVMGWARQRVAEIAGVSADAIKLDLKIES